MTKINRVKQVFDCINSILCTVLCCVALVMAVWFVPQYLENGAAFEQETVITEGTLMSDYMASTGTEYEDILVMCYCARYDGEVEIYDSSEVSPELLENRLGNVVIERCYGRVIDSETGDGEVLNAYDEDYDYISYRGCEEIHEGTLMMTYLVYNPNTAYTDDIIDRYDIVVSHELED